MLSARRATPPPAPEAGPRAGTSVAIIAGSGELPGLIADRVAASGARARIVGLRGFASRQTVRRAEAVVDILDVRATLACLDKWRPSAVTLAGGVRRPGFAAALNAFSAVRNRSELTTILGRGDDQVLRAVIELIEEHGHRLVGVRDLAPDLLTGVGRLGAAEPGPDERAATRHGFALLHALSPYDIGQAAIVDRERVLAVEGPEGTDRMLARAAALRRRWPWRRREVGGVLVKAPKRDQDLRVDLPAIGPRTVANAHRAGLRGIAVASGLTLMIERAETVALADRLGVFLLGVAGRDLLAGDGAIAGETAPS